MSVFTQCFLVLLPNWLLGSLNIWKHPTAGNYCIKNYGKKVAIFERLFVNTHFNKWNNEKVNWQILPQENLYLKMDGTVYNGVEFVTHSQLRTSLASLYLVPSLPGFSHLCTLTLILLQKRKFLNTERTLGTEKEWAALPHPPYKESFHHVQHLGEDSHWLSVSWGQGAGLVILDSASLPCGGALPRALLSAWVASGFAGKMEDAEMYPDQVPTSLRLDNKCCLLPAAPLAGVRGGWAMTAECTRGVLPGFCLLWLLRFLLCFVLKS